MPFNIFDYIDHIYYINLDRREDRRLHVENEIRAFDPGMEHTTRFSAIEYSGAFVDTDTRNRGAIGCSLSHIQIAKMCKENGYKNVLVLEDDFKLNVCMQEFDMLMEHFFKNVRSFYFLLLGTSKSSSRLVTKRIDDELSSVVFSDCTTAYIMNSAVYDDWISTAEDRTGVLIRTGRRAGNVIDDVWDKYSGMRYTFNNSTRHVATQIPGYSDIENKVLAE